MSNQDIEMQISQYADGSLPVHARANLETCMRREPQLRNLLQDYRQLDASFAMLAPPAVEWDALTDKVSSAVASATMLSSDEAAAAGVAGRIDDALARTAWLRTGLAAGLILTLCSGALLWREHRSVLAAPAPVINQTIVTNEVPGSKVDTVPGSITVQVNVGAGPDARPTAVQTAEALTPKAVLAGNVPAADMAPKVH